MTASIFARFYQASAGAPIQASAEVLLPTYADFAADGYTKGFGVKVGATPPVLLSEFEGNLFNTEGGGDDMDRSENIVSQTMAPGSNLLRFSQVDRFRKAIVLDSDWSVGKYVFAYLEGVGSSVQRASPPYRIR